MSPGDLLRTFDLLVEEGERRIARGNEADEVADVAAGIKLIQAAEILLSDAALAAH